MIKRFVNFWRWTKSVEFMIKLSVAGLFNRIGVKYENAKLVKIAENILCKRPYVINTDFGSYLGNSMMTYFLLDENYEPEIKKVIESCGTNNKAKNNDNILINIGCNLGRWAIDCAKNYDYNVIAFEPAPEIYDNFIANVALSKLFNKFEPYKVALGNTNGNMRFRYNKYINNGSSHIITGKSKYEHAGGVIIDVPVKKFDDLGIDEKKIEKTRLVIIDVEGFEYHVLKGMEKSLIDFKNVNIIVEIWKNNKNKEKTIDYMKSLGYNTEKIDDENRLFSK